MSLASSHRRFKIRDLRSQRHDIREEFDLRAFRVLGLVTKSKIFFYFCLSFISGVFLSSVYEFPWLLYLGIFIFGLIFIVVFRRYRSLIVIGFCMLILGLGVWRHQTARLKIADSILRKYSRQQEVVTLVGKVIREPEVRPNVIKLTIEAEYWYPKLVFGKRIVLCNHHERVLATVGRYSQYQYGDRLKLYGKLKTPPIFNGFDYRAYLAKDGIYALMYYPKIRLVARHQGNPLMATILSIKSRLRKVINSNLPLVQGSILAAMVLGDKNSMSNSLKQQLNIAGVRHITAISGMHIMILSLALMESLLRIGFWRSQAFYITLLFLVLFIAMVGFPSSAIRAGVMGAMLLLAQRLGRLSNGSIAIVFVCAVMLGLNPLLLASDVGFQLSFLAVGGIMYLGPIFQRWLRQAFRGKFSLISSLVGMTLSAQIFTLPLLMHNFGRFSLVAPLTNILILPLLPYILGMGLSFAILGAVWGWLARALSILIWFSLTYLTKIVDWISRIPYASIQIEKFYWIYVVVFYLILGYITYRLVQREKLKFLEWV